VNQPDPAALHAWLRAAGVHLPGPVALDGRAPGGSSNVTWFVHAGAERWVLRHPPVGDRLPSANDVAREYRFLRALHGTGVPVPAPIAYCEDPSVVGVPFFHAQRVDGCVLHERLPAALAHGADARRALAEDVIDTLAALHAVDWSARGLTTSPTPYLERQVQRWQQQLALTATATRPGGLAELTAWIVANRPPSTAATIVHGDYGLHNLLVSDDERPRVTAVLDWELAAIGDPIADLVNFLKSWGPSPLTAAPNPANDAVTSRGAPGVDELVARYEQRSGRRMQHRRWYEAFTLWKSVGILEGLHARHVAGTGVDADGGRFGALAAAQLARAQSIRERA
jgi:aminoglycoside phosphotransferase (APT) family kinase protein